MQMLLHCNTENVLSNKSIGTFNSTNKIELLYLTYNCINSIKDFNNHSFEYI